MLSICIPVYNVDVRELVEALLQQAKDIQLAIELLVYDDGSAESTLKRNRAIAHLPYIEYKELSDNMGCATIRNQMAADASFDNLLFIDSDSELPGNYLAVYKEHIGKQLILCGGRVHPQQLPSPNQSLRWKVGRIREDYCANQRALLPNKSFMSNNFLVKKQLFEIFRFDEAIKRSGHEDTMMGIELESKSILIKHIDNNVIHTGLENNSEFILKSRQRIDTLLFLLDHKKEYSELMYKRIKLLKFFSISKSMGLLRLLACTYQNFKIAIERNLNSLSPNLYLYDLYKLGYLSTIYLKERK